MDKNGLYEYATLNSGSLFGDISTLFKIPEPFSYFFNPTGDSSVILLSVKADKFQQIIEKHPLSKDAFINMAEDRLKMFNSYKNITLIKYMKHFAKNTFFVNQ